MDEAASALRLQQESKPEDILRLDQRIMTLQIELESLRKETDVASRERREKLQSTLKECQEEAAKLTEKWEKERAEIEAIKKTKEELEKARIELDQAQVRLVQWTQCDLFSNTFQRENNFGRAGELRYSIIPSLEEKLPKDGESATKSSEEGTLIHESVTADDIAAVVSRMTGIPVNKLTSGHVERLINMEDILRQSVRGQDEALKAVSNAIRMQRAGLNGENRPLASFFFLGPTGVGKTELCKKLAGYLFSTESAVVRFVSTIFADFDSYLLQFWVCGNFQRLLEHFTAVIYLQMYADTDFLGNRICLNFKRNTQSRD